MKRPQPRGDQARTVRRDIMCRGSLTHEKPNEPGRNCSAVDRVCPGTRELELRFAFSFHNSGEGLRDEW